MKALNVGPQAMKGLKESRKDKAEEKPGDGAFDIMLALAQGGQNLPKAQGPLTSTPGQDDGEALQASADAPRNSDEVARLTLSFEHRDMDLRPAMLALPRVGALAGADEATPLAPLAAPAQHVGGEAPVIAQHTDIPGLAESPSYDSGLTALVDPMPAGPTGGQLPVAMAAGHVTPREMAPLAERTGGDHVLTPPSAPLAAATASPNLAPDAPTAPVDRSAADRLPVRAARALATAAQPAQDMPAEMGLAAGRMGLQPSSAPAEGTAREEGPHVEPMAAAYQPQMPAIGQLAATMTAAGQSSQGASAPRDSAVLEATLVPADGLPKSAGVATKGGPLQKQHASTGEFVDTERPLARAHGHVAASNLPAEGRAPEDPSEDTREPAEVEVKATEAQPMPEHAVKLEPRAEAPAPNFEPAAPVPMTRAEAPLPAPEVERAMDLRAVQFSAEQGVTVQHPQLGEMSLAVTRQRGKVEVAAMVQSDDGARLVQANEQGMRMSVQAVGFPFGGLKVRVADRETRDRKAQVVSRERAERRRSK